MEESAEQVRWPKSFKFSVAVGVGTLAVDAVAIKNDMGPIESPQVLNYIFYGSLGLVGLWRIAEPFLLMPHIRRMADQQNEIES